MVGVLAQRFEIGEDRFGEGVVVLLPARAVAGDGVGLVAGAAVVEDFHIAVEVAEVDAGALEVEG